jgi:hypothetical protein
MMDENCGRAIRIQSTTSLSAARAKSQLRPDIPSQAAEFEKLFAAVACKILQAARQGCQQHAASVCLVAAIDWWI